MFLIKTTELAIQSLVYLAQQPQGTLITPPQISKVLETSSSYMSKVLRTLAKSHILNSHRGVAGGFSLAKEPEDITLLMVVEACQGTIVGDYCKELHRSSIKNTCGYHQAMHHLQEAIKDSLSGWTIAQIATTRLPSRKIAPNCKMRRTLESSATTYSI